MDSDLFVSWLENGFMKGIKERDMTLPLLLLIDGAKSHLSIHVSEFCDKHDILYILYPNATHLIQPMDLVLMNCIKMIYRKKYVSDYRRILVSCSTSILLYKCLQLYGNELLMKRTVLKDSKRVGFFRGILR